MLGSRVKGSWAELRVGPHRRRRADALGSQGPSQFEDYLDLHPDSLALAGFPDGRRPPAVRLMLPTIDPQLIFAGSRTALTFAGNIAMARAMPLEICYFGAPAPAARIAAILELASQLSGLPRPRVSARSVWTEAPSNEDDLHIVTFWTTALAAWVGTRLGTISRDRVIYLVQDYEPEFYAGSTESALGKLTYHAGFRLVVNSAPLARYLAAREGLATDIEYVFRPDIDLEWLARSAAQRTKTNVARIMFYARPTNPRNSFGLGAAALRVAGRKLQNANIGARFTSVGEPHPEVRVGGTRVRSLGKLSWDGYFSELAHQDIVLSFQQTPHPSHPPLDAVASGAFAVTNDFADSRGRLSARLLTASADPAVVADRIVEAAEQVLAGRVLDHLDEEFVSSLGRPLKDVSDDVSARLT